jgi:hypothetical protein
MNAQEAYDALGLIHPEAEVSMPAQAFRDLLSNVAPDFEINMKEGNAIHGIYTLDDLASSNY